MVCGTPGELAVLAPLLLSPCCLPNCSSGRQQLGLERFVLCAHSLGSLIATHYALAHPQATLDKPTEGPVVCLRLVGAV